MSEASHPASEPRGEWAIVETFGGDKSFESPVLTYDGAITIYLNPYDSEGAAITLKVASDLRHWASVALTVEDASELAEWLQRAASEVHEEVSP